MACKTLDDVEMQAKSDGTSTPAEFEMEEDFSEDESAVVPKASMRQEKQRLNPQERLEKRRLKQQEQQQLKQQERQQRARYVQKWQEERAEWEQEYFLKQQEQQRLERKHDGYRNSRSARSAKD